MLCYAGGPYCKDSLGKTLKTLTKHLDRLKTLAGTNPRNVNNFKKVTSTINYLHKTAAALNNLQHDNENLDTRLAEHYNLQPEPANGQTLPEGEHYQIETPYGTLTRGKETETFNKNTLTPQEREQATTYGNINEHELQKHYPNIYNQISEIVYDTAGNPVTAANIRPTTTGAVTAEEIQKIYSTQYNKYRFNQKPSKGKVDTLWRKRLKNEEYKQQVKPILDETLHTLSQVLPTGMFNTDRTGLTIVNHVVRESWTETQKKHPVKEVKQLVTDTSPDTVWDEKQMQKPQVLLSTIKKMFPEKANNPANYKKSGGTLRYTVPPREETTTL